MRRIAGIRYILEFIPIASVVVKNRPEARLGFRGNVRPHIDQGLQFLLA